MRSADCGVRIAECGVWNGKNGRALATAIFQQDSSGILDS